MTFYRKSSGSNVAPTTVKRRSGGAWANVASIKRRSGGAWTTVWTAYTPMSATANNVSGDSPYGSSSVIVGYSSCGVTGGGPSKTYSWSKISGDTFTIGSPSSSSTSFSHLNRPAATYTGTYRCSVSDGTSTTYVDITVTFLVTP